MAEEPAFDSVPPTLEVQNSAWPGHLTGELPGGGGGGSGWPSMPPDHPRFGCRPSSLRNVQHEVMQSIRPAVDDYEDLKASVEGARGMLPSGEDLLARHTRLGAPLNKDAEKRAQEQLLPQDDETGGAALQQALAAQRQLLLQCSDAITLCGNFVNLVDRAGNVYVHADKESFLPS
jgi:hypothetical protein